MLRVLFVILPVLLVGLGAGGPAQAAEADSLRGIGLSASGELGAVHFHVDQRSPDLFKLSMRACIGIHAGPALLFYEIQGTIHPMEDQLDSGSLRHVLLATGTGVRLPVSSHHSIGLAAGRISRRWQPREGVDEKHRTEDLAGPYFRIFWRWILGDSLNASGRRRESHGIELGLLTCPSGLGARPAWGVQLSWSMEFWK